jgi:hypothetical protein
MSFFFSIDLLFVLDIGRATLLYFKYLLEQRKAEFKLTDTARLVERILFEEITTARLRASHTALLAQTTCTGSKGKYEHYQGRHPKQFTLYSKEISSSSFCHQRVRRIYLHRRYCTFYHEEAANH